jgi:hypothetical protein
MRKKTIIWIIVAIIDAFIFAAFELFWIGYDDFYEESKGAYFSLESMTSVQKKIYYLQSLWFTINGLFILYLILRFIWKIKSRK